MQRQLLFQGTATAMVTPFKKDGSVDEQALREHVDFQLDGGVEALVPVGTTGEAATLSESEQAFVIETVVDQVNGRVPVIGGATSNSTQRAIALAKQVKDCRADAILSAVPFYNKPTQEGIYRHFSAIAEAVEMPIVIYNVPGRTGCNMEPATTLRLAADIPHIAGVKEASANVPQIMQILRDKPQSFGVWSGDDNLTLPLVAAGADGIISVVGNEVPEEFSEMVRLALKGKFQKARELHYKLLPLMNINFIESNPIPVKTAMALMGKMEDHLRLPLVEMSEANRSKLEVILRELDLIK
jgi:4-hydroxy-tetrahydrodipicolinate synthase